MRLRTRIPTPSVGTPWRGAEFCVLDFETTGLDLRRDEIVSYGAAIVANARIHCGRTVYGHVRPDRPVSARSLTVHTLRSVDLAEAPPIAEAVDELVGLLTSRFLVAHAAWIEQAFLDRILRLRGLRLGRPVLDTAALARACGIGDTNPNREPNLEEIAQSMGLPVHTPHHALGDAFTTAQVFLVLATRLERGHRPLTVRDLLAASRRHRL